MIHNDVCMYIYIYIHKGIAMLRHNPPHGVWGLQGTKTENFTRNFLNPIAQA